jgi:hypothetical protein
MFFLAIGTKFCRTNKRQEKRQYLSDKRKKSKVKHNQIIHKSGFLPKLRYIVNDISWEDYFITTLHRISWSVCSENPENKLCAYFCDYNFSGIFALESRLRLTTNLLRCLLKKSF